MDSVETVVLVTSDSFRYDVLGRSIDGRPCCQFLEELAESGTSFSSAYSTGNGTSAAFPGLLASALPFDHGYRGLVDDHVPIAEHLQEGGVRTVGVTSSSHACSLFNYDRGFDRFYENPEYRPEATNTDSLPLSSRLKQSLFDTVREIPVARDVGARAIDTVRSIRAGDEPDCPFERASEITDEAIANITAESAQYPDEKRFVWIHYMEPHGPYLPPASTLDGTDTLGFSLSEVDELWDRWFDERPELGTDGRDLVTEDECRALERFYLLQARYLDEELRRLHEFIDTHVGYDETLLLFTADHGEEFFEHGDLGHRPKLIDELLHVPLLAYTEAGEQAGSRDDLVSHVDLGPTVARALGVEPHPDWQGRAIAPLFDAGTDDSRREYVVAEICHVEGYGGEVKLDEAIHAVVTDGWKYVRDERLDREEFYRRDGAQLVPASASDAPAERLREIVAERRANVSDQDVRRDELSDDVRDRLHRLGYVGE